MGVYRTALCRRFMNQHGPGTGPADGEHMLSHDTQETPRPDVPDRDRQ